MARQHRRVTRHQQATEIFGLVRQILAGLENHPDALDKVHDRLSVPTIGRILKDFMECEKKREKGEELVSQANERERQLIAEIDADLKHLQKRIRALYDGHPEILEDFLGRG